MRKLFVLILLLSSTVAICQKNSPEDVHARLLRGKKRSLIAYAGKEHSFTMEVVARSVKPSDLPEFINIDGLIVQSTLLPVPEGIDLRHLNPSREKDLLTRYMKDELDYYRKKLRQNYNKPESELLTMKGRVFLLWYFDMPANSKMVKRQVYLSTLFYDQVVDLNIPIFNLNDFPRAKAQLVKLAGTLKTYNKRLDLDLLSKQLNK
ncbi:MAG TPA: hypothetical protein VK563_17305 [Puia sp.]|nr:hypothetical protein [Puia sp.]